ncbi:hypothetical protein GGR53DRAFT_469084 [Hypoxylon sp. FL1150]|nr:hypothetical protein GGR53DRAFT_469084 [Hypoxylon sp. FL1150]
MAQGILEDPAVSIYVHSTKLVVYSQLFLPRGLERIRRVFIALAYYDFFQKENKKPNQVAILTSKHFEKVCWITLRFKDYLKDVNDGLDAHTRLTQDARASY